MAENILVVDVETGTIPGVELFVEPGEAPSNYTDPLKIALYVQKETAKRIAMAAVDIDLARIVVLGTLLINSKTPLLVRCTNEDEERVALAEFWMAFEAMEYRFLTFFGSQYDVPLLLRRSLYLGVKAPSLELGKYKHPAVIDLLSDLTHGWMLKSHNLGFYAKRFGIPHDDTIKGADVAALIAKGDYAAIEKHCADDLRTTQALGRRLGY